MTAVPSWREPRLFVAATTVRTRWRGSAAYPAYRLTARIARHLVRLWTASGIGLSTRPCRNGGWPLAELLEGTPLGASNANVRTASVLVGTEGPAQKLIAEIRKEDGVVRAYLKYGKSESAQRRIRNEYRVLRKLPTGLGPKPLKIARWEDGTGLLVSPVEGSPIPGSLPPPRDLLDLLPATAGATAVPAERHPEVRRLLKRGAPERWIEPLIDRSWPVVVRHGDLTPWNLHRRTDGRLQALDWEYGSLRGFPCLDLAHFALQVGTLIYGWSPRRALRRTVRLLADPDWTGLERDRADAVTRLAAYDAYQKSEDDGHDPDEPLQRWRRALWNRTPATESSRERSHGVFRSD